MKYLLDSNILIEAKNHYYDMTICPGFWHWILSKFATGDVASISHVADELLMGKDSLTEWVKQNRDIFLPVSDKDTQNTFAQIAAHISEASTSMNASAMPDFLGGADPWLIAKAITSNAIVVTQERYNPESKRKFLIPNICKQFQVEYINTFDLLRKLKAEFILQSTMSKTES